MSFVISFKDVFGEAETAAEGVLYVFGEEFVDGIGLVAGEDGKAAGRAVGDDELLHDTQEASVEGEALGEARFTVITEDPAAVGGERDARSVGKGSGATGSAFAEIG